MLDIKFIRENRELVEQSIKNKNEKADIKKIIDLDVEKRKLQFEYDQNKALQNKISKQIPILKKERTDITSILTQMKETANRNKDVADKLKMTESTLKEELLKVPNIPAVDIPIGDESNNEFIREWGSKPNFDFTPMEHLDLAEKHHLLETKRATKLSGSGFIGYYDKGALLERALINFMLDFHILKHGYTEISLPVLVNRTTMTGTGQLPKLENDMYHINLDDLFLVPTAEVSVTNYFAEEILSYADLPVKFVSYSPCFRREAGSYGKNTKGLQRLHQFNKVEMVRMVNPNESDKILEEMVNDAEDILQALNLHYRVVKLATGDLSFASAKTYDLEVWSPGTSNYLEVSSVSNFRDFQARRASIRYRDENGKVQFVHTLNGSGLATPRLVIALLETYQTSDGRIKIPDILKKYLRNLTYL